MKILALTTVYPGPGEPQKAPYVRTRLQYLADTDDVKLLVPVPAVDYGNPAGKWLAGWQLPLSYRDRSVDVLYRRWFYPPSGGALNALFLFLRVLPTVARLRARFPFEAICADFAHPEGVCAAMLASIFGVPFTVTLRGNELANSNHWARRRAMGWALRRAARVVALSDELRALAIQLGAAPGRAVLLPNGVDAEHFHPRSKSECRRKHNLREDEAIVLSAGQLRELKGHHRIVECLKGLRAAGIPARLVIAGGPGRADRFAPVLKEAVTASGMAEYVTFAGDVSQDSVAELMAAADVFCLASSREGWPNVVNEALACGTPVVSTEVGAIRRLLPSPQYGFIVPVNDRQAMEDALAAALRHTWDHAAIARWGGARSWKNVAAELREHLLAITGNHTDAQTGHHHR